MGYARKDVEKQENKQEICSMLSRGAEAYTLN